MAGSAACTLLILAASCATGLPLKPLRSPDQNHALSRTGLGEGGAGEEGGVGGGGLGVGDGDAGDFGEGFLGCKDRAAPAIFSRKCGIALFW